MTAICALVLARAHIAGGTCAPQPLHAQTTVPGGACPQWACAPGYFRTVPQDPALATCRACRSVTCPAGYATQPCNGTSDTQCSRCPGDPNVLFAAGCTSPRCADGWFNDTAAASANRSAAAALWCSAPCPVGSYCEGGVQYGCGPNGTTVAPGAATVVQCTPDSIQGGAWIAVAFDFSVAAPPLLGDPVAACGLQFQLGDLLTYGTFTVCTAAGRDSGQGLLWSAACYAGAAPDAAGSLSRWYLAALADGSVASGIQTFMAQACLRRPDVLVGSIWAQPQPLTPSLLALLEQAAQAAQAPATVPAPLNPQRLQYPAAPGWGSRTEDAEAVAAALGIGGTAVPLGLAMTCAGVYAQCTRRRRWRAALHAMALNRGLMAEP